jgi:hypothetical protein
MIRRSTWITLAAFIVLLAFSIWWTRYRPEPSETGEATPTLEALWQVAGEQIVALEVEDLAAGDRLQMRLGDDGAWQVVEPEGGSLTEDEIQTALQWLASPQPRAVLSEIEDLSMFGLEEPQARITLSLADGTTRRLDIGRVTPTGTTTYVRLPDRAQVQVVTKYGLQQVLDLIQASIPDTPTPTATETATAGPETTATPIPLPTGTATP